MRWAEQLDDPLTVKLKTGEELAVMYLDGGGIEIAEEHSVHGEQPHYEVHGAYMDGSFLNVPQDQIEKVAVARTGEELEFGNPFHEGHPRPQELDTLD